jgi:hypothetical protein
MSPHESLPCLQQSATFTYSEPDESISYFHTLSSTQNFQVTK